MAAGSRPEGGGTSLAHRDVHARRIEMTEHRPPISERSPSYQRSQRGAIDPIEEAGAQTVGTLSHMLELERDMIASLLAVRSRLGDGPGRGPLDELLVDHADRLPLLEQQIRELGGAPPGPGERAGELPRDAGDIAYIQSMRDALRALADDHEALSERYREALAFPHHTENARRMLEIFSSDMEQQSGRLAALLAS